MLLIFIPIIATGQDYAKAVKYFDQEKFASAKPIFQSYLNAHPQDEKTREYLGDIASHYKKWDEAVEYYGELVEEDKSSANYHFKYGGSLGMMALGMSKLRAVTYISDVKFHMEEAARLDPNHIEARWGLVELYLQLPGILGGGEDKSIIFANQLAKISPVDGYLANGHIAETNNRPKDAERYYMKAIEVGGSAHTYEKLSSLYEKNDQPSEAIETTSKSLKIHKRNQLNYQIGKISAQYDVQPEYGIESLQNYISNFSAKDGVPKDWAYYRLAQIYRNKKDKTEALKWINKALAERSEFKEAKKEKDLILRL